MLVLGARMLILMLLQEACFIHGVNTPEQIFLKIFSSQIMVEHAYNLILRSLLKASLDHWTTSPPTHSFCFSLSSVYFDTLFSETGSHHLTMAILEIAN